MDRRVAPYSQRGLEVYRVSAAETRAGVFHVGTAAGIVNGGRSHPPRTDQQERLQCSHFNDDISRVIPISCRDTIMINKHEQRNLLSDLKLIKNNYIEVSF